MKTIALWLAPGDILESGIEVVANIPQIVMVGEQREVHRQIHISNGKISGTQTVHPMHKVVLREK